MVEKENECDFKLQQQMKQAAIARLSELQITVSSAVLHHQNQSPAIQQKVSAVFGAELHNQPLVLVEEVSGPVPKFLVEVGTYLTENLTVEGLFRKTGSIARQKEVKRQLDQGKSLQSILLKQHYVSEEQGHSVHELPSCVVHDLANLLKQFVRELPQSLFTDYLQTAFLQASEGTQLRDKQADETVTLLCFLLPEVNRSTLSYLANLLNQTARRAASNFMDTGNLSVVFAPNLLPNCRSDDLQLRKAARLLALLIDRPQMLSCLPAALNLPYELHKCCAKHRKRGGSLKAFVSELIRRRRPDPECCCCTSTLRRYDTQPLQLSPSYCSLPASSDHMCHRSDPHAHALCESVTSGAKRRPAFCFSALKSRKRSASASPGLKAPRKAARLSTSPLVQSKMPLRQSAIELLDSPALAVVNSPATATVTNWLTPVSLATKMVHNEIASAPTSLKTVKSQSSTIDARESGKEQECEDEAKKENGNETPVLSIAAKSCGSEARTRPKVRPARPVSVYQEEEKNLLLRERLCRAVACKATTDLLLGDRIKMM